MRERALRDALGVPEGLDIRIGTLTQRFACGSTLGYHCFALLHPVTRNTGA